MAARVASDVTARTLAVCVAVSVMACGSDGPALLLGPDGIPVNNGLGGNGASPLATALNLDDGKPVGAPCRWLSPGAVKDVAFSPNGKLLATASGGYAKLYDAASGAEVRSTPWHWGEAVTFSFSAASDRIAIGASGYEKSGIYVYQVADMSLVAQPSDGNPVSSVAFSPDGKWLAAATHAATNATKSVVDVWSTTDFKLVKELEVADFGIDAVGFSHDGATLQTVSENPQAWSTADWTSKTLPFAFGNWSTALHPSRMVLANDDTGATVTSPTTVSASPPNGGTALGFQEPADGDVTVAIKSHDGTLLAAGNKKGHVFLWEVSEMRPLLFQFAAQVGAITGLAFTPDDGAVAAASDDGSLFTWIVRDGTERWHAGAPISPKKMVGASRDGSKVVVESGAAHTLVSSKDGSVLGTFPLPPGSCTTDPAAERLACKSSDGPNFAKLGGIAVTAGVDARASDVLSLGPVAIGPDASLFAQGVALRTAGLNEFVIRLSSLSGAAARDIPVQNELSILTLSDDGALLLGGRAKNLVGSIWDLATGAAVAAFGDTNFYGEPSSAVVSPDKAWATVVGDHVHDLIVFDIASDVERRYAVADASGFDHAAASPGGNLLAVDVVHETDHLLTPQTVVLDARTGSVVATLQGGAEGAIAFLSETTLVRGEADGATSVWCF